MGERFTTWFPIVLLAVLAGLTFWLDRVVRPFASGPAAATRHDPDYIVDGLAATRMSADGAVKHTLYADRMTHYPDDDTTHLTMPKFVSYASAAPVTVSAREGLVSSEGENIHFRNNVRVVRAPFANKSELVLETSYLHVIPDQNLARTDQPVTITDANTVVHAVGLELNSETQVLKLFSRVRGIYHDPDRPKKPGASR